MIQGIRALLLDLDGVLYVEDAAIAGAPQAVRQLRERGLALRFVTNTTARSHQKTLERLSRLGFAVPENELITPAALAVQHCREREHRTVELVMNDEVKEDFAELTQVGEQGALSGGDDAHVASDAHADAVIVGDLGPAFGYDVLNRAFQQVMNGAELIALQKNRYWLRPEGLSLDVGPFVAALEYATGQQAYVVGKPSPAFFEEILAGLGVEPSEAAMVGDDIESDIGGALRAGLAAVLVQTGKYREDAVKASGIEPTATVASIVDVPGLLSA